jgi:uncharacterized membrane protein
MPCLNESILLFARLLNYFLKRRELKTILFSKILTITNIIITIKKIQMRRPEQANKLLNIFSYKFFNLEEVKLYSIYCAI